MTMNPRGSIRCLQSKRAIGLLFICLCPLRLVPTAFPAEEDYIPDSQTVIRAEVALVNIILTAMDKKGRPVSGLKSNDFEVFDNTQPQNIEYFGALGTGTEVPLTIALLIDTSGSVKDKLEYEKQTAAEFLKQILRPKRDSALTIQFDSAVRLVQDVTQDYDALVKGLDGLKA